MKLSDARARARALGAKYEAEDRLPAHARSHGPAGRTLLAFRWFDGAGREVCSLEHQPRALLAPPFFRTCNPPREWGAAAIEECLTTWNRLDEIQKET